MPHTRRRRLWPLAAAAAVLAAAVLLPLAYLSLAAWDARRAAAAALKPAEGRLFSRHGGLLVLDHPAAVRQVFPARKAARELRVFVLGSSQAMGTPYVHQNFNILSGTSFGVPNEGGLSTWLKLYLEAASNRSVTVVNAAMGYRAYGDAADALSQVLETGSPDAVVLLEGSNERPPEAGGPNAALPGSMPLQPAVDRLTRGVRAQLALIEKRAAAARVPVLVLTAPANLRDWRPTGTEGRSWFDRGCALTEAGDIAGARRAYEKARDLDRSFLRARGSWNDAVRALGGRWARALDLEKALAAHARDGIPGADLFHDYCHLTLAGNRIAGLIAASRLSAELGLARTPRLEDAPLGLFKTRRLAVLYWIKAFKWARAARLGGLDPQQRANSAAAAASYLTESRLLGEQIHLLRSGTPAEGVLMTSPR